jgi:uncharacterized protein
MALRIQKTFQVQEPLEKVWAFLSDPRKVVTCLPGTQVIDKEHDKTYAISLAVKMGSKVNRYRGNVQIVRLDAEGHESEIKVQGRDSRGSASVRMTWKLQARHHATEVTSVSEVTLDGILAQIGTPLTNSIANVVFETFRANLQVRMRLSDEELEEVVGSEVQPIDASSMAAAAVKSFLGGDR